MEIIKWVLLAPFFIVLGIMGGVLWFLAVKIIWLFVREMAELIIERFKVK